MSVEKVREELIQLERDQQLDDDAFASATAQMEKLIRLRTEMDSGRQKRRREIIAKRRELDRVERLAASAEQAAQVRSGAELLQEKFERLAEGKVWNEGVLPHQWNGMMFGAVAKRWVLGDAPGLGKTWQSMGWLDLIQAEKVIAVVPADVCDQWAGEAMTLAPDRHVTNLYKLRPDRRHELLDEAVKRHEGLIVVNYEIWRQDKDTLAKLMLWQADTIIVDEAHQLKNARSAAFKNIKTLMFVENTCPLCYGPIKGLYEPQDTPLKKKTPRPCPHCKWTIGDELPIRFANPLEDYLKTRSIKNALFTTGTPILNSPADLFALLHLCDPILFDTERRFLTTYCTENFHNGKLEFRPGAVGNLKPLIEGRFKARSYDDAGVKLPPQHVHVVRVDLDKAVYPLQHRTITQITKAAQILLDNGKSMTIMHLIALVTRKRQANVWPGGIELKDEDGNVVFSVSEEVQESVKMDEMLEKMKELHAEGKRQVVFSQFRTGLAEFEQRVAAEGIRVVRLDGSTPPALRKEIKTNFYAAKGEEPKWDVLLANYKTGGVGLNLTSITATHILDEEWNPGKRDQAYARSARMGQSEETDVYVYRIPGTIDTWMANTIAHKEGLVDEFNDAMLEKQKPDMMTSLRDLLTSGEIL